MRVLQVLDLLMCVDKGRWGGRGFRDERVHTRFTSVCTVFKSVFAHMCLSHSIPPAPTFFFVDDMSLLQVQGRMHTDTHTHTRVCTHTQTYAHMQARKTACKAVEVEA